MASGKYSNSSPFSDTQMPSFSPPFNGQTWLAELGVIMHQSDAAGTLVALTSIISCSVILQLASFACFVVPDV